MIDFKLFGCFAFRQTNGQMDIWGCRVAFATENYWMTIETILRTIENIYRIIRPLGLVYCLFKNFSRNDSILLEFCIEESENLWNQTWFETLQVIVPFTYCCILIAVHSFHERNLKIHLYPTNTTVRFVLKMWLRLKHPWVIEKVLFEISFFILQFNESVISSVVWKCIQNLKSPNNYKDSYKSLCSPNGFSKFQYLT